MPNLVPLELLRTGERGRIDEIDGEAGIVHRLEEMGFRRGVDVRMLRPGCPCILAVDDHRMTFRCETGVTVLVDVATDAPSANAVGIETR